MIVDTTAAGERDIAATFIPKIAGELKLPPTSVAATARLLAEGATVPFIARYRKEATGSLDEVAITSIRDRMTQLADLETRRSSILKSLDERKLLTTELRKAVNGAQTMTALEDIFAPFRPKRRTRATIAREKGLEPLADWLLASQSSVVDPASEAAKFLVQSEDKDKAVPTADDALAGARDIIAERISDDAEARGRVRTIFEGEAVVSSKVLMTKEKEPDAAKFRDYFQWSEPLARIPSHRLLAIRRGEAEGFLMMRVTVDETSAVSNLNSIFVKANQPCV